MEIAVLVEPLENKGYRVTSLVPGRFRAADEAGEDRRRGLVHRRVARRRLR